MTRRDLRALIPEGASAPGVRTDVALIEAKDVARAIVDEAARFGADVVCIGSHGDGAGKRRLGAVAQEVMERSPCPVLLVRARED
jgi:nucleotide-binding universal stress UspA family protein